MNAWGIIDRLSLRQLQSGCRLPHAPIPNGGYPRRKPQLRGAVVSLPA
jgi:hypothetical protein